MKRAEAYFAQGQYLKAEIEYRNAGQLSRNLDPQLVARLATIYYEQGRITEAFPLLTNVVNSKPDDLDIRYKLGTVWISRHDFKQARDTALFILTRKPVHHEAMLLLVDAADKPEDVAAARTRIKEIVAKSGETWSAHVALAELALRDNQAEIADKELQAAVKLNATNPYVNVARSQLASLRKQPREAEQFLRAAASESPARSTHRLLLPQFLTQQTNSAEAKLLLDKQLKDAPDYVPAWVLRGQIALAERDFSETARIASAVLAWAPLSYDIRLLRARTLVLQQQPAQAVEEFKKLEQMAPNLPEPKYEMAVAYVRNGAADEAVRKLNEAIRLNSDYGEAVVLRAELKLRMGAAQEAVDSLFAFTRKHPEAENARLILAHAYRRVGRTDEPLAIYREFMRSHPLAPDFPYFTGTMLLQRGQTDQARSLFEQALKLDSNYILAAEQLVNLNLARSNYVAAQLLADQQTRSTNNLTAALILKAKVCFAQRDWAGAEAALRQAIRNDPNVTPAYSLLANVYLSAREPKKALAELNVVLDKNPADATALMLKAVVSEALKDYKGAQTTYEGVLKVMPNSSMALNQLAYLLCEQLNQTEKALTYALQARQLDSKSGAVADTLGWIYYRRGDLPRALPLLREGAEKIAGEAEAQYHLAMGEYTSGNEAAARNAFVRLLALDKSYSKEAARRVAVLDLVLSDQRAAEILDRAVKDDGNDFPAAFKSGQVYQNAGANEKARVAFERAARINPTSPKPLISLALLHASQFHDLPKALDLGRAARKLAPNDPAVAGVVGRISYRAGDYAAAMTLLQENARVNPADTEALYDLALASYAVGQSEAARKDLRNYLSAARGVRLSEAKDLNILLGFLAGTGNAPQVEPLALKRLLDDTNDLPALMTLGMIAEQKGSYADAAQKLERVAAMDPLLPAAQRELAVIYAEHLQNDQKAYDFGNRARPAFASDAQLAAALGKTSYRRGDYSSAVRLLKESLDAHSNDPVSLYWVGLAYQKLQKKTEAKTALNQAISLNLDPKLLPGAKRALQELQ